MRYTAPDSITANPEVRTKKALAEKEKKSASADGLTGVPNATTSVSASDFVQEETVELCGG